MRNLTGPGFLPGPIDEFPGSEKIYVTKVFKGIGDISRSWQILRHLPDTGSFGDWSGSHLRRPQRIFCRTISKNLMRPDNFNLL